MIHKLLKLLRKNKKHPRIYVTPNGRQYIKVKELWESDKFREILVKCQKIGQSENIKRNPEQGPKISGKR